MKNEPKTDEKPELTSAEMVRLAKYAGEIRDKCKQYKGICATVELQRAEEDRAWGNVFSIWLNQFPVLPCKNSAIYAALARIKADVRAVGDQIADELLELQKQVFREAYKNEDVDTGEKMEEENEKHSKEVAEITAEMRVVTVLLQKSYAEIAKFREDFRAFVAEAWEEKPKIKFKPEFSESELDAQCLLANVEKIAGKVVYISDLIEQECKKCGYAPSIVAELEDLEEALGDLEDHIRGAE